MNAYEFAALEYRLRMAKERIEQAAGPYGVNWECWIAFNDGGGGDLDEHMEWNAEQKEDLDFLRQIYVDWLRGPEARALGEFLAQ